MVITDTDIKWKMIVEGKFDPPVNSFALKIKINFLRLHVKNQTTSSLMASKELAEFCRQNEKTFTRDLEVILS